MDWLSLVNVDCNGQGKTVACANVKGNHEDTKNVQEPAE